MTAAERGGQARAMDRMYRHTRHVYDLTRRPYLLGRDRMLARLDPPPGGTVLEVACGTARNLIAAARRWPTVRLHGFDISEEMLKTARANVARAGLGERITLARGDATAFDAAATFGVDRFDRVFVSYALSMIPDWRGALAEALRLTAPDGRLAIADFGDAAGLGPLGQGMLTRWLALFHVHPRGPALEAELRHLAGKAGRPLVFEHAFRRYADIAVVGPAKVG